MSIAKTILSVFAADEVLTNAQICERTGFCQMQVIGYLARLRNSGDVERAGLCRKPVSHRLAGGAKVRADMVKGMVQRGGAFADGSMVGYAYLRGRTSAFDPGRLA